MSSIKLVNIVINREQENGKKKVVYEITLTDDLGDDHLFTVGPKFISDDPGEDALVEADRLLATQSEDEAQAAEGAIEDGDGLERVLATKWNASKKIAKRLILFMMRERDPRLVVLLEPLIQYLRDNYTATQLANWLDITVPQVLRMNRRINAILSDTGNVKTLLAAFDAEEGDFEE